MLFYSRGIGELTMNTFLEMIFPSGKPLICQRCNHISNAKVELRESFFNDEMLCRFCFANEVNIMVELVRRGKNMGDYYKMGKIPTVSYHR